MNKSNYHLSKPMKSNIINSLLLNAMLTSLLFLGLISSAMGIPKPTNNAPQKSRYIVAAYVFSRDAPLRTSMIAAHKLTRIYYAFGNVRKGKIVLETPMDKYNLQVLDSVKQQNPHLQLLLSVGGWSWSRNFSDAVLSKSRRKRFINSGIKLIKKYNLDGIDIDWEYPGQVGDGNIYRPVDKQNFTLMLKGFREKLNKLSSDSPSNHHYYITIAAGANQKYLDHTDMRKVQKYLDEVNLMTYDYYNGSSDSTGYHTNLYPTPLDPNQKSIATSVNEFIKAGVPRHKIVIGAAFYGHGWIGVNALHNGRYQPSSGDAKSYTIDTLRQSYINKNGFRRYWDTTAKAPYLWDAKTRTFITYDDVKSIINKANYVIKNNLGGMMFWQYTQDSSGKLLNAMSSVLDPKNQ